jgi:transposase
VLYDYQQTRAGTHPREFLSGYKGYLHVDGYSGYNEMPDITLVGCWAHARRKFDEALKILPPDSRSADVAARQGLEFCNQLFAIERDLEDATPDERCQARLERSRPVLDAFLAWLNDQSSKALYFRPRFWNWCMIFDHPAQKTLRPKGFLTVTG